MPTTAKELLERTDRGLVREVRQSQLRMAEGVQDVLDNGGVYMVDAPTGVGKSLAYLVPALLTTNRRVVIATAKKSLQDQIRDKDIPAIARTVGSEMAQYTRTDDGIPQLLARSMKGKSNYACQLLAEKHNAPRDFFMWLDKSQYGDRAEYPGAPPSFWNFATAEDCIGRGCDHYASCKFTQLKQDLSRSKAVVVNHHLLGSDMFYGFGKLVGGAYDILIVDEAHKLADGIRAAYTQRASAQSMVSIAKLLSDASVSFSVMQHLIPAWARMFADMAPLARGQSMREAPVFDSEHANEVMSGLNELLKELENLIAAETGVTVSPDHGAHAAQLAEALMDADNETKHLVAMLEQTYRKVKNLQGCILTAQGLFEADHLEGEDLAEYQEMRLRNTVIYDHMDGRGNMTLCAAPVSLGGIARNYFSNIKSVIIASATLAVTNSDGIANFDHVVDVVGIKPTRTDALPPAFDYKKQGFLYVPKDMPHRTRMNDDYASAIEKKAQRIIELVRLSNGGAFILTTANDELDIIGRRLKASVKTPVYVQGHGNNPWDGDPAQILQRFLKHNDATLVGSKSFFEGVDVQGEQLRLVIIVKLPFPLFSDPILQARKKAFASTAESFAFVDLIDMLIDLKQGVGRLIRSVNDRGVVAILDSRIWEKGYGRTVTKSLHFPVTSKFSDYEAYMPRVAAHFASLRK